MRFSLLLSLVLLAASTSGFALSKHCSIQINDLVHHTLDWKDGVLKAQELQFQGQDSPEAINASLETTAVMSWNGTLLEPSASEAASSMEVVLTSAEEGMALVTLQTPHESFRYRLQTAFCIDVEEK